MATCLNMRLSVTCGMQLAALFTQAPLTFNVLLLPVCLVFKMAYLLQHLLTESAQRLPEKAAVQFQGEKLTYRQLERCTNQVARTLQAAGVQRGDRIGIYLHKSLSSIISVFGVLKAGAVYVPLDPNA